MPTTHPQPPSGASGYSFGPKKFDHLALEYAMLCSPKEEMKKEELAKGYTEDNPNPKTAKELCYEVTITYWKCLM